MYLLDRYDVLIIHFAEEELVSMLAQGLVDSGLLAKADSPFAAAVAGLVKGSCDLVKDAADQVPALFGYPLQETTTSEDFKPVSRGVGTGGCGRRNGWVYVELFWMWAADGLKVYKGHNCFGHAFPSSIVAGLRCGQSVQVVPCGWAS
jgi:hypothetical protein